ncbi:hypothetical protein ACFV42_23780 [Streptomyces solisilvae]|uniref:hypothetical protein n=1 Tax=Streptomyces malaysiensis TaxID=92644 RepID=UPI00367412A8
MEADSADVPWAHVRLVDPAATPRRRCNRCGTDAILQFKADFRRIGYLLTPEEEVVTQEVTNDVYSCSRHAGELAFAAAYAVVAGPTGAV